MKPPINVGKVFALDKDKEDIVFDLDHSSVKVAQTFELGKPQCSILGDESKCFADIGEFYFKCMQWHEIFNYTKVFGVFIKIVVQTS